MARYHILYAPFEHVSFDDGACTDNECLYEHAFVYRNNVRGALLDVEHDGTVHHWRAFPVDDSDPDYHQHHVVDVSAAADDLGSSSSAAGTEPDDPEHGG